MKICTRFLLSVSIMLALVLIISCGGSRSSEPVAKAEAVAPAVVTAAPVVAQTSAVVAPPVIVQAPAVMAPPVVAQAPVNIPERIKDSRDGKEYKIVKIGEQTWMAENLSFNAKDSKCYDDNAANCTTYGRLYNWETAMKACPAGWHLPTLDEWNGLTYAVGGMGTEGKVLKSKSLWHSFGDKFGTGDDKYGFSALPAGLFDSDGFNSIGNLTFYWVTSEKGAYAGFRSFSGVRDNADWGEDSKSALLSVRCLKGEAVVPIKDSRDGKTYKTVKIGEQIWMAENLSFNAKESRCYGEGGKAYEGNTFPIAQVQANCVKYGRLYNWEMAMKVCPNGWHLPSKEEFQTLVNFAGGEEIAGNALKAKSDWAWNEEANISGNGTDNYGFSALPGGSYSYYYGSSSNSAFYYFSGGKGSLWWSSSENKEYGDGHVYEVSVGYLGKGVDFWAEGEIPNSMNYYSVRCIKD